MAGTKSNSTSWKRNEPVDWRFCVRGKNPDDQMVTLGNYVTESEARARYDELVAAGRYRNLSVQQLKPKAPDPAE